MVLKIFFFFSQAFIWHCCFSAAHTNAVCVRPVTLLASGKNLLDVISIPLRTGIEETRPNFKNVIAIRAVIEFVKLLVLM